MPASPRVWASRTNRHVSSEEPETSVRPGQRTDTERWDLIAAIGRLSRWSQERWSNDPSTARLVPVP